MMGRRTQLTYDDFAALPEDGKHYEVLAGVLYVNPSPGLPHQHTAKRAFFQICEYFEGNGRFSSAAVPVAQRCLSTLIDTALAYFVAFTNRFPTSRAARPWVEVAATFLAELKPLAREPILLP